MDPFENNEQHDEQYTENPPQEQEPVDVNPEEPEYTVFYGHTPRQTPAEEGNYGYHGTGVGRKESPFANSPYERIQQPAAGYRYQPQAQPPQKPKKEKKNRKFSWKPVVAVMLILALVAGSCLATASMVYEYWEERHEESVEALEAQIEDLRRQMASLPAAPMIPATLAPGEGYTPGQLYAACVDSVVAITSTISSTNYYGASGESSGSGFIMSEDGYILTNYHVVEGATSITVVTHDGTEYPAELLGYDASTNDLAVLKIEATGLRAAVIGSSSDVMIGDMVAAIGNPLGELTATQTIGYVSGIGREVATDSLTTISMIQTDAAINPGNSGGPLFNMRGEVIGITTAKYSGTTNSGASIEGIGFAIPIDDVMSVVDDLIEFGYVTGAYMGVSVQNTDEASAEMFGLPTGAYIVSVDKGGAADRAGIKAKDIVVQIGQTPVSNVTDLTRALRGYKAGDTTTVVVLRGGTRMELEITLDAKPQTSAVQPAPQTEPSMPEGSYEDWFDFFYRYFGG